MRVEGGGRARWSWRARAETSAGDLGDGQRGQRGQHAIARHGWCHGLPRTCLRGRRQMERRSSGRGVRHTSSAGARMRDEFAQPRAPWGASSAGGGIFFEVPHSSGLFSRQGTPLFEDTCEARGERSVGGRGRRDGAIGGCASSRSACHRLWARGAWPRARLCCACCRDGGLLRTDGPVSSLGGCHVTPSLCHSLRVTLRGW